MTKPDAPTAISFNDLAGAAGRSYYPAVLGMLNDHIIYTETLEGDFFWHQHAREQLYLCIEGEIGVEFRDRTYTLKPLESLVIPAGVEHRPLCPERSVVVVIEPKAMFDHEQSSGMYDEFDRARG
jgi:mannose-6-phosphate isomerase-like protein (cupin superfamily)